MMSVVWLSHAGTVVAERVADGRTDNDHLRIGLTYARALHTLLGVITLWYCTIYII